MLKNIGTYGAFDEIDIITDHWHVLQKKYQEHSALAVGEGMHTLLNCVHITSADDPVPQQCDKMVLKKLQ